MGSLLVFCRKDLCEARPKRQCVFKFSDVLFSLSQMGPPVVVASGQVDIFVRSWVRLTFGQMYPISYASGQVDIFVRSLGQLTFGQMYPPSMRLQVRLSFLSDLWVRLSFCQMYPLRQLVSSVLLVPLG